MGVAIEELPVKVPVDKEQVMREAAIQAAYDVQGEMDELYLQIKQLLATACALNKEPLADDNVKHLLG